MAGSIIAWCLLVIYIGSVKSCHIWGHDTGECQSMADYQVRENLIPFCSRVVTYDACVPVFKELDPASPTEAGRWASHTTQSKDAWVEEYYERIRKDQIASEKVNGTAERFFENPDCQNAFYNYFCWVNFPRCNSDGESLRMCRSVCENYFISCGQASDLWRCGEPEYFNGYVAEVPSKNAEGNFVYMRDFFPGQPFRDYQGPGDFCTPSIKGAGSSLHHSAPLLPRVFCVLLLGLWLACRSIANVFV